MLLGCQLRLSNSIHIVKTFLMQSLRILLVVLLILFGNHVSIQTLKAAHTGSRAHLGAEGCTYLL